MSPTATPLLTAIRLMSPRLVQYSLSLSSEWISSTKMPLKIIIRKSIQINESGKWRTAVTWMTFLAFVILGLLEHRLRVRTAPSNSTLEATPLKGESSGRRYCDPPNMTALVISYESHEGGEEMDDYEFFLNQEPIFQSNLSTADREALRNDKYYSWGLILSYIPASQLGLIYKPENVFGPSVMLFMAVVLCGEPSRAFSFVIGFLWGVSFILLYKMGFNAFKPHRRNSFFFSVSGSHVGLVIGELLVGFSVKGSHILFGGAIVTILWYAVWVWIVVRSSNNRFQYTNRRASCYKSNFPLKDVLCSRPIWMAIAAIFGASCGQIAIEQVMKLYIRYVSHVEVGNLTNISYLLYSLIAFCTGHMVDLLQKTRFVSVTSSRRMVVYVSHFIPAGLLFVLGFVGCGSVAPVAVYCLAVTATGANYAGAYSSPLDLSPNYAGTITALCFTVGSLGRVFVNFLTTYILTQEVVVSWRFLFSLNSLILLVTAIFFMLRGSGSVQPWNDPDRKLTKEAKNNQRSEEQRVSVVAPLPKPRTRSIYTVEKKILKVLHVQEPEKFTRVRAYSTSFPTERTATGPHNVYRPSNKKRASIS